MKFTLSWLKDFIATKASAEEIAEKLTSIGLEVESLDKRKVYQPFIVVKVLSAQKHPNADKLQILSVDTGAEKPLQVVCGAPNARAGLIGVLAQPGVYVPGLDTTLAVGKIRDVESFGMMCSESELLLSDEHNGIIDIDEAEFVKGGGKIGMSFAKIGELGQSFAKYLWLNDPIFDVSLTPNRGDCASVYGIARDLAAAGMGRFSMGEGEITQYCGRLGRDYGTPAPEVIIEDEETCQGFAAARIEGLYNMAEAVVKGRDASLDCNWIRNMRMGCLRACRGSLKNTLEDITDFYSLEYGQPVQIYDADKLHGALHIRRARQGESLAATDGKTYHLNQNHCVIADDSGVIALSGIIDGARAVCDAQTTRALLVSARWKKEDIARAGRDLGIVSESRYRFERGIDPILMDFALTWTLGAVYGFAGDVSSKIGHTFLRELAEPEKRQIKFPVNEVKRLTGLDVSVDEAEALLKRLYFKVKRSARVDKAGGAMLNVTVPSWRADIEGKADLVEEIIRLNGLDKITPQPLEHHYNENGGILTPLQSRTRLVRRALAARAMDEAVTYSFISAQAAEMFGGAQAELKLANPIAADMSDMRPNLLPNLLAAAKRNADRGFGDIALFELGDVYHGLEQSEQRRMAAGVRAGTAGLTGAGRLWSGNAAPVDCFTAKADALAVLEALGMNADNIQAERGAPSYFHPGRSGALKLGPKITLGYFGELHPSAAEFFGLRGAVSAFELFLDAVPEPRRKSAKTKPPLTLSPFQPVKRDFSFIVDEDVTAAVILRAVSGADKKLISNAQVFDIFAGDGIEAGKKAVGIEVTIQPAAGSLTDKELEAISQKIIANVLKSTGGALR